MASRDVRTVFVTAVVVLLLAAAWIFYVAVRPAEVTSGGGTAIQAVRASN